MATKQKDGRIKHEVESNEDSEKREKFFEIIHKLKMDQIPNDIFYYINSFDNNEFYSSMSVQSIDTDRKLSDYLEKINKLNIIYNIGKERKKIENDVLIEKIENRLKKLEKENRSIRNELNNTKKTIFSIVNNSTSDAKIQYMPIDIYIDTNDPKKILDVYDSVIKLIKYIDFEKELELEPIKGSWYKKILAKSKEFVTEKEVNDRLKEVEYALEVKILKDQSEIDKNQSEALLNILKSVENIPKAAIKIGSLLVVKITSELGEVTVQVRSLSILELHLLNKRPDLLLKPTEILGALAGMIEENNRLN